MFRLLSYNIQRGIRFDRLLQLFDEVPEFRRADVIAIQEASFHKDGRNLLQHLAETLSSDHRWTYQTVMQYPDKEYGNGFLFRHELEVIESYRVSLPQVSRLRWYEKQKTEGGQPDSKSAFVQCFLIDGRTIRIANVHLDFSGGAEHRNAQLRHLLSEIAARSAVTEADYDDKLEFLCGDFNTIGYYRLAATRKKRNVALQEAISSGFVEATGSLDFTSDLFRSVDPSDPAAKYLNFGKKLGIRFRQKTDHILVKGRTSTISSGVVRYPESRLFEHSDHLPIWTNIRFEKPTRTGVE